MALSKDQIENLLSMIGETRKRELNCEECLALVAEFAEAELRDKSVSAAVAAVKDHLAVCAECCEEYEVLLKVLRGLGAEEG